MPVNHVGTCPSSEKDVSLGATLPVAGSCHQCGASFVILAHEDDGSAAEGEVTVTLLAAPRAVGGSRPLPRPLWQLTRLLLLGLAAIAVAFVLLFALITIESGGTLDSDEDYSVTRVIFGAILGLGVVSVIGTALLWFLLGSKGRQEPAFDAVRSLSSLAGGFLMMLAVGLGLAFTWPMVEDSVPRAAFASVVTALTGILGGWVIARLAPLAPFKHALALGIAIPLALASLLMLTGALGTSLFALVCAGYLPLILAGAWLSVRLRPRV